MILPGTYSNGFAPRDGEPLYPQLWRGCVGAWNPGLGPTGLTLRDWSAFKNHGALTNMVPDSDWVRSEGRYALDFDGSNDHIPTPIKRFANLGSVLTLQVWFYTRSTVNQSILGDWNTSGLTETGRLSISGFNITSGHVGGNLLNNGGIAGRVQSGSPITINRWYHIALVRTVTHVYLYLNGSIEDTVESVQNGAAESTNLLTFGRTGAFNGLYFNGIIDDIRIYNRKLSPNEIRLLATRRGIAYEMAPQRRTAEFVAPAFNRRRQQYQQLVGGGII